VTGGAVFPTRAKGGRSFVLAEIKAPSKRISTRRRKKRGSKIARPPEKEKEGAFLVFRNREPIAGSERAGKRKEVLLYTKGKSSSTRSEESGRIPKRASRIL